MAIATRPNHISAGIDNVAPTSVRARLERAYRRVVDTASTKCGRSCGRPGPSCAPEHCEAAISHAKERFGIELERTRHRNLPLMGEYGCTAAPYLRPDCAIYLCESHLQEDATFAKYYREELEIAQRLASEFIVAKVEESARQKVRMDKIETTKKAKRASYVAASLLGKQMQGCLDVLEANGMGTVL